MSDNPWDATRPWYHGSDQQLTRLRVGSSVTQRSDLARAFSHRPTLVGQSDNGSLQHNGIVPGYLYLVDEPLGPSDLVPHPHPINATRWEWLTTREVRVRLLEPTSVRPEEQFTDEQVAAIRRQQHRLSTDSFLSSENPWEQPAE